MRSTSILFTLTTSLGLCALNCSAEDPTLLDSTSGTSNAGAGQQGAFGGSAGVAAGTGGTVAGGASGGSAGTGGSTGGTLGAGGFPSGGAGAGGASGAAGMSTLGAGAGGRVGPTATGGSGGSVPTSGGATGGAGMSGAGPSGGSGAGMAGSGTSGASAGGAPSMFAPVADIIGVSCATNACHPNSKGQHSNLHNTDGKLYERLLATGATITGADAVCAKLPLVVAGSPETSLIMTMIAGDANARGECGEKMPYKCPDDMAQTVCLTADQTETIRSWIAAGALP